MDADISAISPRLARLQKELVDGQDFALEDFWQEIERLGSPLIEPIPGNEQDRLVTFLYRSAREDAKIGLISNLLGKLGEFEKMFHLPGTDIWYISHQLPSDTRETYQFSVDDQNIIDPLNSQKQLFPMDEYSGIGGWESSIFELPDAPPQLWFSPRPGVPAGQVVRHSFRSEILDNTYPVWIYTPPEYSKESEPFGFLVMLDGFFYTNLMPASTTLDNLLAEKRLPPLVAIMIGTLYHDDTRKRDYGCYPPYLDFLSMELLPWVRQEVRLTNDPQQTAIVGASRGGLMAGYIALNMPDVFGNVLCQSGSFGWKPEGDPEGDWLARQYMAQPKAALRFYLEAGLFETDLMMVDGFSINLLASNRHLRDVLQAKGYPVHYREFSGGHSTVIYRGTLADGLLALLGSQASEIE